MAPGISVSLVIPVRDEAASVKSLIFSIRQQVRQPDEVVFVDGGSSDATADTIRRLTAGDARYRLLEAGPATPGRGRNVGIEAARHPWVALTDAGINLDARWLDRLVRAAEHDSEIDVVYGSFSPAHRSYFERCADLAYVSPLTPSPLGPVRSRSVASCLLRKEAWSKAGGFPDLRAAEDRIFMRRLEALGSRIASAPEASVTWELAPTLGLTFQRFRRYSMHNVRAGEQSNWHHGVLRMYLTASGLAAMAWARQRSPLRVIAVCGGLRVARTVWRRREGRSIAWAFRPDRMATVAAILATIDAATFVGWLEAYLPGRFRPAGS